MEGGAMTRAMMMSTRLDLCSLCSQSYRSPRTLPCLHSFCESCLEKHQQDVCGAELTCPVEFCQQSAGHTAPKDLSKNVWLETSIHLDAKLEVLEGSCGGCDEERCTEMFCSDCGPRGMALCSDCTADWHRKKPFKTHSLVPITEELDTLRETVADRFFEPQEEEKCSQHTGELCEYFCTQCNKLSCFTCLTGCCKGHKLVQTTKRELQCSVQTLKSPVKKLKEALLECEKMANEVSACEKKINEEIETAANEWIASLTKQKHELLKQCHDIARSKHTRLNLQVEQLKKTKQQIEHCTEAVSTSCNSYTTADLLPVKELMMKQIENLVKMFEGEKLIPCTSSGITMFHCMPQLGEVSDGCYPPLCVLEVPAGKPVTCTVGIEKELRLVTMNEAGEMFGKGGEKVEAHLSSHSTSTSLEVVDNLDGSYQLSITSEHTPGEYQLAVKIHGCHVLGSPFRVSVEGQFDLERKEIEKLRSHPLKKGDIWYLVDQTWLKQWKEWCEKQDACPGPIDNSGLFGATDPPALKDNLKEGLHYAVLPKPAWDILVSKYSFSKSSQPIQRRVVSREANGKQQLMIEVYSVESYDSFKVSGRKDQDPVSYWGLYNCQYKGNGTTLMVLDTGINENHDSFISKRRDKLWTPQHEFDRFDNDGHGTLCAIIACGDEYTFSLKDGREVTRRGVAPSAKLGIWKAYEKSNEATNWTDYLEQLITHIEDCDEDVDVLVISSGCPDPNAKLEELIHKLVHDLKIIVVCAGSNRGARNNDDNIIYPARYLETICVGAHDHKGRPTDFSPVGEAMQFLALGTILFDEREKNGTSFAAPAIGGLICLILNAISKTYPAALPHIKNTHVLVQLLRRLTNRQWQQWDNENGYGAISPNQLDGFFKDPKRFIKDLEDQNVVKINAEVQ